MLNNKLIHYNILSYEINHLDYYSKIKPTNNNYINFYEKNQWEESNLLHLLNLSFVCKSWFQYIQSNITSISAHVLMCFELNSQNNLFDHIIVKIKTNDQAKNIIYQIESNNASQSEYALIQMRNIRHIDIKYIYNRWFVDTKYDDHLVKFIYCHFPSLQSIHIGESTYINDSINFFKLITVNNKLYTPQSLKSICFNCSVSIDSAEEDLSEYLASVVNVLYLSKLLHSQDIKFEFNTLNLYNSNVINRLTIEYFKKLNPKNVHFYNCSLQLGNRLGLIRNGTFESLSSSESIQQLKIKNTILKYDQLRDFIVNTKSLSYLSIDIDQSLPIPADVDLQNALYSNVSLKHLKIYIGNGIIQKMRPHKSLIDLFSKLLLVNTTIESITFKGDTPNFIGKDFFESIKQSKTLKSFKYSFFSNHSQSKSLTDAIKINQSIEKLTIYSIPDQLLKFFENLCDFNKSLSVLKLKN